jgi:hypothetical protein
MSEIENQVVIEDALPEGGDVVKHKRPKIKRREVVNGKPKLGRPKKSEIEKKKNPGRIGRPPGSGDGARIAEFKARLLATAGDSVINKVIEKHKEIYNNIINNVLNIDKKNKEINEDIDTNLKEIDSLMLELEQLKEDELDDEYKEDIQKKKENLEFIKNINFKQMMETIMKVKVMKVDKKEK